MTFFDRQTNFPMKSHGVWWLTQFRRWGMVKEPPDYKGLVDRVHRPDIFREVAKEMGIETPREDMRKETLFDGVTFDPAKPEEYCQGLPRPHDGRVVTRPSLSRFVLPLLGLGLVLAVWTALSQTIATDLPSPARTWSESRRYVLEPFFKDGEMNQGIGRLAFYSLVRVGKGYLLALLIGTPIGFMLGLSRKFYEAFDPIIQFLRPISPLAWLPLGLVICPPVGARRRLHDRALRDVADRHQYRRRRALDQPGPPERRTRAEALALPDAQQDHRAGLAAVRLHRLPPLARPRVARHRRVRDADGHAGRRRLPVAGVQQLVYSHIILSVITIGAIGFLLDRLMGLLEARLKAV